MTDKKDEVFESGTSRPGVLVDDEILEAVSSGYLVDKDTFLQSSLEASSYDIRVGFRGMLGGIGKEVDLRKEPLELAPGSYGGILSYERFKLPQNICARIGSKRALSYDGIILLTGSTVDPGYEGHLLFGLFNASQRKVMIRHERKLCNVVFERLAKAPQQSAPIDPNLRTGSFPDAFVDRMANMEVLPWLQISDRVKEIEQITRDILDLKARYEDVLKPIRDLTENVKILTRDVSSLAGQTKSIADDVNVVNSMVAENSKQIMQLTANLAVVSGTVQNLQERSRSLEEASQKHMESVNVLQSRIRFTSWIVYIFWTVAALVLGAWLPEIIRRLSSGVATP